MASWEVTGFFFKVIVNHVLVDGSAPMKSIWATKIRLSGLLKTNKKGDIELERGRSRKRG